MALKPMFSYIKYTSTYFYYQNKYKYSATSDSRLSGVFSINRELTHGPFLSQGRQLEVICFPF